MTLEEIRYQISNYEEKREKLALLLIDLSLKLRSLNEQAYSVAFTYDGSNFSFEIMDAVVAESYAILKEDIDSIDVLDTLRKELQSLNVEKQGLQTIVLSTGMRSGASLSRANDYRSRAQAVLSRANDLVEQIERSFREKFGVENPYRRR